MSIGQRSMTTKQPSTSNDCVVSNHHNWHFWAKHPKFTKTTFSLSSQACSPSPTPRLLLPSLLHGHCEGIWQKSLPWLGQLQRDVDIRLHEFIWIWATRFEQLQSEVHWFCSYFVVCMGVIVITNWNWHLTDCGVPVKTWCFLHIYHLSSNLRTSAFS